MAAAPTERMTEREKILGRIREALRLVAPRPHDHTKHDADGDAAVAGPADWLPFVGPTFEDRVALFARNSVDLKSTFESLDGDDAWLGAIRRAAAAGEWRRVAAHRTALTERAVAALGLPTLWTDDGYDARELEQCDVGLTGCDALVAQTGSVLVTSRSAGGRALSVLPPHHVVLARRDQLIADVPAAFALLKSRYAAAYPSFLSLITGPSRTGDIERILVLGAHGPKQLTILCH